MKLSIKELEAKEIDLLLDYWYNSEPSFLQSMGADKTKLPTREDFQAMLNNQLAKPIEERNAYCLIWELDGKAIGHSNTNPTQFGDHAYMHLHIWYPEYRRKGLGEQFLKLTIKTFFKNLKIKNLYSQPYALNNAPNKTLQKIGFQLIEELVTIPGSINFEQKVKKWIFTEAQLKTI